jgi:RimJ/RimL family protein N-acetyltransferase
MITLETTRLSLQPIALSDLDALAGMWADPAVTRYLPGGQPRSREASRVQLEYMLRHAEEHGFGVWAVRLKSQAEMIGYCGLLYLHAEPGGVSEETARSLHEVEMLYGFSAETWGKGIGREAAGEVFRYGFQTLDLPRIAAAIHTENTASRRILEGLGMQLDPALHFYGECPHFAITREQYAAR